MENYFTININNILNSIVEYFIYLKENPWRLIVLILDLAIVSGLIYKFIKYSKKLGVATVKRYSTSNNYYNSK